MKTLVVKIGTNAITRESGLLNEEMLDKLVKEIAALRQNGVRVILVSSGAMGAGRGLVQLSKKLGDVARRQVLAAVGQAELIRTYQRLFREHGLVCAQVLATKEDFGDRRHYLNMRHCFEALLSENIIPVVNENDVVSVSELMFTDNDELAGLIACMMDADKLALLSTVDGILDATGKRIPEIRSLKNVEKLISPAKSSFGRGGMITKGRIAEKLAKLGIETVIARASRENVLIDLLADKPVGSVFRAKPKRASGIKKWIAQSEGKERGVAVVNACAEKILRENGKAVSLLPVGIVAVRGEFEKGDLIRIENESGEKIGYGLAQTGAEKAKETMGQHGKTPLIHYDYLYIHD